MELEDFERATEKHLREEANGCLGRALRSGPLDRPGAYMEAQFYINEIARRHDARIVRRDFILELIIILLIVGEIAVSFYEGAQQDKILSAIQNQLSTQAETLRDINRHTTPPPYQIIPGGRR